MAKAPDDKMDDPEFQYSSPGSVDRVAVRLLPFWPEDPEVWFSQVEAQFEQTGIRTDGTMFNTVVSQLDHRFAKVLRDVVVKPPATGKYARLKAELIKRLSSTVDERIEQLLNREEMGDRKPSQFLRDLRTLAEDRVDDNFLKKLWASRLPAHVRAIIAAQTKLTLDETADIADKVCEVMITCTPQVASAGNVATSTNFDAMLEKLEDRILARIQNGVAQQIAQLTYNQTRGRPPAPGNIGRFQNNKNRSRSRSSSRVPGVCWYYNVFGEKAQKCTPPCCFKAGNGRDST